MREGEPNIQFKYEKDYVLIVVDWHEGEEHKYKAQTVSKSEIESNLYP